MSGELVDSMAIVITSAPGATSSNYEGVSTDIGTFSYVGAPPSGFSRVSGTSGDVSAIVGYSVSAYNTSSSTYNLTASLSSGLPGGMVWKADGLTLSTTPVPLATSASYGSGQFTWLIAVNPTAAPSGPIVRIITLMVTAN